MTELETPIGVDILWFEHYLILYERKMQLSAACSKSRLT